MKRGTQLYLDIELVARARLQCDACGLSLSEAVTGLLILFCETGGNGEGEKENHDQEAVDQIPGGSTGESER